MAAVERLLGSNPRTKVAESLIRLGDLKVSRADIAREAGLFRASTNRIIADFESEGIITRIAGGKRPLYQANLNSPYLLLLARFAAALELVNLTEAQGSKTPALAHAVASEFSSAIQRISNTATSGSRTDVLNVPTPGSAYRRGMTA